MTCTSKEEHDGDTECSGTGIYFCITYCIFLCILMIWDDVWAMRSGNRKCDV